jgi:hypothetical protein
LFNKKPLVCLLIEREGKMGETKKKMIEEGQVKKIHTLKNALQLTDEHYRKTIFANFCPARGSKDLNYWQAEFLINNLEAIAIKRGVWGKHYGRSAYEDLGNRDGMATPKQLRKIDAIWKDISKSTSVNRRRKAFRGWLFKYFKVSDLRFVDSVMVSKIIHTLEKMRARDLSKESQDNSEIVSRDRAIGEPF